jgi:hypothetical protein
MMTVQMESLPFLQREDPEPPQSQPQQLQFEVSEPAPVAQSDGLFKNMNPITILLIGVVIGVIFVSMRPIVIQK